MRVISGQNLTGSTQTARSLPPAACRHTHRAFTLVELLIVMAILVLAITLAVPAIRSLTGSRSQEGAQNTIQAFLTTARAEAIGLQRVQGVMFYIDPATDRVTLAQVMETPAVGNDTGLMSYLDLVPNHDTLSLPPGIRCQMLKDVLPSPPPNLDFFPQSRYLGFNIVGLMATKANTKGNPQSSVMSGKLSVPLQIGGVILFDGEGRLTNRYYAFRTVNGMPNNAGALKEVQSSMGHFLNLPTSFSSNYKSSDNVWTQGFRSAVGLVLFDRESFLNQHDSSGVSFTDDNTTAKPADENSWLDTNSTPLIVNRYNGTLTRAE